jgi:subtilisin family serine protease
MRKTSLILGVCSLTMLIACKKDLKPEASGIEELSSAARSDNPVAQAASDPYTSNEVLVKFKKGFSETGRANALAHIGGNVQEKIITNAMKQVGDEGFYVVHTSLAVLQAVEKMKGAEGVEYAEPNYIYTHDATSTDTYYTNGSLWGMYGDVSTPANQYGSQAAEAWASGHTGSNTVYVGIIDEGSMFNHTDLAANFWTNPFDPVDGIDNDGNGFKDDVHGWDFDGNNNSTFDGTQDDHGTHVAGTIGAVGGNGTGVAGVCWNVKMISAKFLGRRGGTTANAVKAVDYFTDLKIRDQLNIVATNNSWGGGGFSQALQDAITRAGNANILFIAAAGNDGYNLNNRASYPASYTNDNIIAVAAIASNGTMPSWSNYGSTSVDLGAPGSGIYSTLPGKNGASSYGSYSGTSMATPHVTGAAALYASTHPGSTAANIKAAILGSAVPTSSLSGKCVTGGRLNVSGF